MTLPRWITRNWTLKLTALFISLGLYIAITGQPQAEVGLSAPLIFRGVPSNLVIVNAQLRRIHVRLSGPVDLVSRASRTDLTVQLNLADAAPGRQEVNLSASDVQAPFGLRVVNLWPTALQLNLQPIVQRWLRLEPRVEGQLAAGSRLVLVRLVPKRVLAIGPASYLRNQAGVLPVIVNISGIIASTRLPLNIHNPNPMVRLRLSGQSYATLLVQPAHQPKLPPARRRSPYR